MDGFHNLAGDEGDAAPSPLLAKRSRDSDMGSLCTIKIARLAPRLSNQRLDIRRPAANEQVVVQLRGAAKSATVINTSSGGAMIESDIEPIIGEALTIQFGESAPAPCIARWVGGGRIGVEFGVGNALVDQPRNQGFVFGIGGAAAEDEDADAEDKEAALREPRQSVIRTAQVRAGDRLIPVRICNISTGGVMLESEQCLPPGAAVRLEMAGNITVTAEVRWNSGKRAGLSFADAIDPKGLGSLRLARSKVMRPSYLDSEFDPESPWAARFERLTIKDLSPE